MRELRSIVTKKVTIIDKKWYFSRQRKRVYFCRLDTCAEPALIYLIEIAPALPVRLKVRAEAGATGDSSMGGIVWWIVRCGCPMYGSIFTLVVPVERKMPWAIKHSIICGTGSTKGLDYV